MEMYRKRCPSLVNFKQIKGNERSSYISVYYCMICDHEFTKFTIFEGHFAFNKKCRRQHNLLMQCYLCGYEFRYLSLLKYHLQKHLLTKEVVTSKQNADDRIEIVGSNSEIAEHCTPASSKDNLPCNLEKIENGVVRSSQNLAAEFNCKFCERSFTRQSYLNIHEKTHKWIVQNSDSNHLQNPTHQFNCTFCERTFKRSHNLGKHLQSHKSENGRYNSNHLQSPSHQLKCTFCDRTFRSSGCLKNHEKTHMPKNQNCDTNLMNLTNNENKLEHQNSDVNRLQNPKHQFKCTFCERTFKLPHNLRKHLESHKSEIQLPSEFKCKFCKQSFSGRNFFKNHMKTHKIECYLCHKNFVYFKAFKTHFKRHCFHDKTFNPVPIHVANFSPAMISEIIKNQPVIVAVNLNVNRINLRDLSSFIECRNVTKFESSNEIEKLDQTNCSKASRDDNIRNAIVWVPQKNYDKFEHSVIVDVSSDSDNDSDVEEISNSETYYCYFCNKSLASLFVLGRHVKKCEVKHSFI